MTWRLKILSFYNKNKKSILILYCSHLFVSLQQNNGKSTN